MGKREAAQAAAPDLCLAGSTLASPSRSSAHLTVAETFTPAALEEGEVHDNAVHAEKPQGRLRRLGKVDPDAPRCVVSCISSLEACADHLSKCADNIERRQLEGAKRRRDDDDEDNAVTSDPMWKKKGMIPVVFVVLVWVYFVYVWRLCASAIRQQASPHSHPVRLASQSAGIGLLIGFNIFWFLTIWSYITVVLTPPGVVNDYVETQEYPPPPLHREWLERGKGGPYLGPPQSSTSQAQNKLIGPRVASHGDVSGPSELSSDGHPIDPSLPVIVGPAGADIAVKVQELQQRPTNGDALMLSRQPDPADPTTMSSARAASHSQLHNIPSQWNAKIPKPARQPPYPGYAPLAPCNRYCYRCRLVKTNRAHHCRHCGKCIMKMDHHCPWIGGCVGARNHKFFYHFVFWVTALEAYVVVSTAVLFARGAQSHAGYAQWTIDGFVISLFPICLIFFLFTFSLLLTHSWLIASNQTTIEHLGFGRISRREDLLLSSYYSKKGEGGPGLHLKNRHDIRKGWDREWGRLRWEINLWKVEVPVQGSTDAGVENGGSLTEYRRLSAWCSRVENWRQTMGTDWWMWLFPLGRPLSDGLEYPVNPRHGPYGEWRPRREWPEELR